MSDHQDQIFGKVSSDLDPIKRILSKLPAFGGYVERQTRRDADKLLREAVASRFEEQWQRISGLQRDLINQGQISYVDDLEAAAIKLRTFADRVRRAPRGYSGLFDAVKINEEELNEIYRYDADMLDVAEEVGRAVDNVESSIGSDGLPAAIRHLTSLARQAVQIYERRDEVVTGTAGAVNNLSGE
jgi:hypothetical protein